MTETSSSTGKATGLVDAMPTDALLDAGQRLLGLLVQRAAQAATERVGELSDRLTGVAANPETGLRSALRGGTPDDDEPGGEQRGSFVGAALGAVTEKVKGALGAGGGGSGGSGKNSRSP